ncbi:hypothetical protein UNDKW_1650 [Undibacterium sp. KW1]|uniref:helix-turn-helix domain-containing protein n=1 Tax=Undibacterium sp. KW1 TaxID=2058624 RepID=UPI001331C72D|nr:helix-turn-helix transcriptional regulator [Undibacterium sp. KW1]BBB59923.1 hypothetical protein UNDKW_1650 [Undibacterium sp. KW1]
MNIADRIDIAMKTAGIKSQADLSRASGVSESTIGRVLKGGVNPSIENLAEIAKACNVSMDWIVNGNDTPNTEVTEMPLVHVTQEELTILTQFREATARGKSFIKTACNSVAKKSTASPDKPES